MSESDPVESVNDELEPDVLSEQDLETVAGGAVPVTPIPAHK